MLNKFTVMFKETDLKKKKKKKTSRSSKLIIMAN